MVAFAAVAVKNGFVHVDAEAKTSLRRSQTTGTLLTEKALMQYELAELQMSKKQQVVSDASTDAGSVRLSVSSLESDGSRLSLGSLAGLVSESTESENKASTGTVCVFRNFQMKTTQRKFLNMLLQNGFERTFDIVHFPVCPETWEPKGFAFVRFTDAEYAQQAIECFHGTMPFVGSQKTLAVEVSKRPMNVHNLVAMVSKNKDLVPEQYPLLFDAETGKERVLPTPENRNLQNVPQLVEA